jgi:hypothetical protein
VVLVQLRILRNEVPSGTKRTIGFKRGEGKIVRREGNEDQQGGVSHSQAEMHYEVNDSVELARRRVLPVSWVRGHVRSRVTNPIPHIRFGRYVRFRWGPEMEGWLAEHMVSSGASRKRK